MSQNYPCYSWLALICGNSRLHWALFDTEKIIQVWDSPHFVSSSQIGEYLSAQGFDSLPLYVASVVPSQTQLTLTYPKTRVISLADIPLLGVYPTLGIDRALALWGCAHYYGAPCLVIDAGTALTLTGINGDHILVGGAILPGLGLQLKSLGSKTAALPDISLPEKMPPRWANNTPDAISSGVIYTILAGIKDFILDWDSQFPHTQIVITGGDGKQLLTYLHSQAPSIAEQICFDSRLIFRGIERIKDSTDE